MLWIDVVIHALHLLAAAVWVGGMIFTAVILAPVLRRDLAPPARYPLFKAVGLRFAVAGRIALTVLVVTGIYKLVQAWGMDDFWGSHFGKAISFKIVLVAAMIALSLLHDFAWGPKLESLSRRSDDPEYRATLWRLSFWSRVNLALAVAIVCLGAYIRMNPF